MHCGAKASPRGHLGPGGGNALVQLLMIHHTLGGLHGGVRVQAAGNEDIQRARQLGHRQFAAGRGGKGQTLEHPAEHRAARGTAAEHRARRHQYRQHQRDGQRHTAHPVGQADIAVAAGGQIPHQPFVYPLEHRQHPDHQHRQNRRHQPQQHRRIHHRAAQLFLQPRLGGIVPGQAVQHRFGAAGLFTGGDHPHRVGRHHAGFFHRVGQAVPQQKGLVQGLGRLLEQAVLAVLAQQAGGLVRLDARPQQQGQIFAQGADCQRAKFLFRHDASSFPVSCAAGAARRQ